MAIRQVLHFKIKLFKYNQVVINVYMQQPGGLWQLQGVAGEVALDGLLEAVGALEELLTLLGSGGPLAGVQVLIQQLPEVIRHVQHLQVSSQPK